MSTETYEEMMVDLQAPAGFAFNYKAYAECSAVSWRGPYASTDDETLHVAFDWDPSNGTVGTLDVTEAAEYTVRQMREFHTSLGAALASLEATEHEARSSQDSRC